jgi:lipoprotein
MEITKISAATFGGSGCEQPVEQGFALISFSTSCHSLEIGSSKLVKVSQNLTDKKSPKRAIIYACSNLAGTAGFEPANAGTKTQCLTTWRRPTIARTMTIIARQPEKIHTS